LFFCLKTKLLKAEVELDVYEVVVVLVVRETTIVYARILSVNLEILGEVVVQTALIRIH
jgi:hypothetical protein